MASSSATELTLRSGETVLVRRLQPEDGPGLVGLFERLSEDTRYRRFFARKPRLSDRALNNLLQVDHHNHEALVAADPTTGELLGVARFIRSQEEPDSAEVAVTVVDSRQGRGVGTALMARLSQRAVTEGIRHFTADILAENTPALELVRQVGELENLRQQGSTVDTRISIPKHPDEQVTAIRRLLQAAARGEFISLPGPLQRWLDASRGLTKTLLVPVTAVRRLSHDKPDQDNSGGGERGS